MIITFDISLTSTGICAKTNKGIQFINVVSKDTKIQRKLSMLTDTQVVVLERTDNNILNANIISNYINELIRTLQSTTKDNEVSFVFENYIMNSKNSTSLFQIVEYTSIIKYNLMKEFGWNTITTYSPCHVKKEFAKNGKADKNLMHDTFKEMKLEKQPLWNFSLQFKSAQKGLNDLIDAFALLVTFNNDSEKGRLPIPKEKLCE